jgi:hypothetical protein
MKFKFKKYFSRRNFLLLSLSILIFVFLFNKLRKFLFILSLIGINCAFGYLKHFFFKNIHIGKIAMLRHLSNAIEFITFSTVISTYIFGPLTGMITGGLSILGTYIFEKRISQFSLATIPLYVFIGYLSFILKPLIQNIAVLGVFISIFYNLFINLILIGFYKAKIHKIISFSIINIIFNIYLFFNFSSGIKNLI